MQVVIMAGGKGERIANISQGRPKPMIDICGKPLLEYQIETLKKQNFKDILLITGFKGVQIQDYFKKGEKWGLNIQYYNEEHPLGTAGALSVLKKDLEKHFLLINGDLFFELDFKPLIDFHIGQGTLLPDRSDLLLLLPGIITALCPVGSGAPRSVSDIPGGVGSLSLRLS